MPFLNIQGKWFPLEGLMAKQGPDGEEIEVWDLEATLLTQGDDMAEAIEDLLDAYAEEVNNHDEPVNYRLTDEGLMQLPTLMVDALNTTFAAPERPTDEAFFAAFHDLEPRIMAHIVLQFLGPDPDHLSERDIRAATEFAIVLGPDWAQKLYHFVVKITKIA